MNDSGSDERVPTRDECIAAAAEIYDGILNDPVRRAEIRAARAAAAARRAAAEESENGQPA